MSGVFHRGPANLLPFLFFSLISHDNTNPQTRFNFNTPDPDQRPHGKPAGGQESAFLESALSWAVGTRPGSRMSLVTRPDEVRGTWSRKLPLSLHDSRRDNAGRSHLELPSTAGVRVSSHRARSASAGRAPTGSLPARKLSGWCLQARGHQLNEQKPKILSSL